MEGPEQIFLDRRVVSRMADQPTPEADEIGYVRADIVRAMVQQSQPQEFFIHVTCDHHGLMYGLTNFGRLFESIYDENEALTGWAEIDVPVFEPPEVFLPGEQ